MDHKQAGGGPNIRIGRRMIIGEGHGECVGWKIKSPEKEGEDEDAYGEQMTDQRQTHPGDRGARTCEDD